MRARRSWPVVLTGLWLGFVWPRPVRAGMPMPMLTDMASARLSAISFFLLVLLLCAWAVKAIWNGLAADLPRLPKLTYGKACGLVTLWGLLFLLVLTMISGARELLTPGAWEKQGLTYKLAETGPPSLLPAPYGMSEATRRAKLERLRSALWAYARTHGAFPAGAVVSDEVPEEVWQVPDPSGLHYLYMGGRKPGEFGAVLAYEPGLFGPTRMVLTADGVVQLWGLDALRQAVAPADAKGGPR